MSAVALIGSQPLSAQSPQVAHVTIVNGAQFLTSTAYSPDVITVVMGVNNTVEWLNNDTTPHTAVGSSFDSGNIDPNMTVRITFNQTGTFMYHCIYHPNMQGKVIVKGSGTSHSSTTRSSISTSSKTTSTHTTKTSTTTTPRSTAQSSTVQSSNTTESTQNSTTASNGVPEFSGQLIPLLGFTIAAVVMYALARRRTLSVRSTLA